MVPGWLIALTLVMLYLVTIVWLQRTGRMERYNLSLMLGFVLMIRTTKGRKILKTISTPTGFWNLFGDLGVVVAYLGMAAMTLLMLSVIPTVLDPDSGVQALRASEVLVIPGVNPFVPLWYGIIALIVTLVVHEGGHGILSLANKMRVKTLGLLVAVIPIGAFVEPDEDDLMEAPRRKRLRVYAAGPAVNFAVAFIVLGGMMAGAAAMEPHDGAPVWRVTEDGPAHTAGIQHNTLLVAADGIPVSEWRDLQLILSERSPGDVLAVVDADNTTYNVTLGDRWTSFSTEDQDAIMMGAREGNATCDAIFGPYNWEDGDDCATKMQRLPVMGIHLFLFNGEPFSTILADPFESGGHFLTLTFLPIGEVRGSPILSSMPDFFETPFSADLYWPMIILLFWVFWMNLMVGLTNILPMLPLDGGHLFRDGFGGLMEKLRPNMDGMARDRIVGRVAGILSLIILGAFLLQIFGPGLAQTFAG